MLILRISRSPSIFRSAETSSVWVLMRSVWTMHIVDLFSRLSNISSQKTWRSARRDTHIFADPIFGGMWDVAIAVETGKKTFSVHGDQSGCPKIWKGDLEREKPGMWIRIKPSTEVNYTVVGHVGVSGGRLVRTSN